MSRTRKCEHCGVTLTKLWILNKDGIRDRESDAYLECKNPGCPGPTKEGLNGSVKE